MKTRKLIIFKVLGCLFLTGIAHGQVLKTDGDTGYRVIISEYFKLHQAGKNAEAANLLAWAKPNPKDNKEESQLALDGVKNNLNTCVEAKGQFITFDKFKEVRLSEHVAYMSGVAVYQYGLVRYLFFFYKPKEKWEIYYLDFNANISESLMKDEKSLFWESGTEIK